MQKKLLIVAHQPSANTQSLASAAVRGARHEDISGIDVCLKKPVAAGPEDILGASGVILGSTENFGYMAGLMKDFLERIYYPCLEKTDALPWSLYIRAGNDGTGAKTSIERIITGLKWKQVQAPLICCGDFREEFVQQVEELGMTMAAGLEAGIF